MSIWHYIHMVINNGEKNKMNNLEMNMILDALYTQRDKIEKANLKFDGIFQKDLDANMALIKKVYADLIADGFNQGVA